MRFVIITGISGAGKSQAVKALEDLGYFCIDNLPPILIPKFAEICSQSKGKINKIALVIDIRGGMLLEELFPGLSYLKDAGIPYEILFLDASNEVLIKRFKESRRSHPLSKGRRILSGILEERKILEEIKKRADYIIETSSLTSKKLKDEIVNIFNEGERTNGLIINIISFGFKYGIPQDADLIFDVRFIPNPFYISELKKLSGKNKPVIDYVLGNDVTVEFVTKLHEMLLFLIPNYITEGKSQLIVGIGCTGGRHRSVAISDKIHDLLKETQKTVIVEHRDIDNDHRG